jgi:hypothetical protein
MLLAIRGGRQADILFGDGNRLREFPGLVKLQAALVYRLQLRGLVLRADWNTHGNQQRNRYQTCPARGASQRERNQTSNSAGAADDD